MLRAILLICILTMTVGCAGIGKASAKGEALRMTKEELKDRLGASDLVILDVRAQQDWEAGEGKIRGAVREDPGAFDQWAAKYPKEKTLVLYCA